MFFKEKKLKKKLFLVEKGKALVAEYWEQLTHCKHPKSNIGFPLFYPRHYLMGDSVKRAGLKAKQSQQLFPSSYLCTVLFPLPAKSPPPPVLSIYDQVRTAIPPQGSPSTQAEWTELLGFYKAFLIASNVTNTTKTVMSLSAYTSTYSPETSQLELKQLVFTWFCQFVIMVDPFCT